MTRRCGDIESVATCHRWWGTPVLLACVWCLLTSDVFAQGAGGTLNGTVTDPNGAAVVGAEVIIQQKATGQARTVVSNERGFFTAPNLSPGAYDVTIVAPGFATFAQEGIAVVVGGTALANVQLKLGDLKERVEVVAAAHGVELGTATLSRVVGGDTVRNLPLNGRDWTMMAALEPGVHTIEAQSPIGAGGVARTNRGWGTQMSFAGNRPQQNSYRLDGVSINDYSGGGPGSVLGSVLGVDAIQEFSVVTGNASADYGKTSGGVINAVTRAGSNDWHGSAYEFHRNDALDASNFFDRDRKPDFTRNQFGAAIGGPVRKNRMFFFLDYEGLRQKLGTTNTITVPSRAARSGQLSDGPVAIDPAAARYLELFQLPNGPETGDAGAYSFVSDADSRDDLYTGRLDHGFSVNAAVHGTFQVDRSRTDGPDAADFVLIGQISNRKMASVEETHIFSSRLVNVVRFGYSDSESFAPIPVRAIDPRMEDTSYGFLPGRFLGTIEVSGLSGFDGGINGIGQAEHIYRSHQAYDDLVYTLGAHVLKLGAAFERILYDTTSTNAPNGRFTFGSLRNFLVNRPQTFNASIPGATPTIKLRQNVFGAYVQDDVRVRTHATLNMGLRYEIASVPTETQGRLSNLADLRSASPRVGSPYFSNPTLLNFSPRLGFAWDPFGSGKTAIRSGFGIYGSLPMTYLFPLLVVDTGPFFETGILTTVPQGSFPTNVFALLRPNDTRYSYIDPEPKLTRVSQWNANIEQYLPGDVVAHVGYTGQRGEHLPFRTNDANIVVPTQTMDGRLQWPLPAGSGVKINPNVGVINALAWIGESTYHGLNVSVTERRKDTRFGVSYTWSKSRDFSSSSTAGSNFNNSIVGPLLQFPQAMRGPSDFNVTHNVVVNGVWSVPSPASHSRPLELLAAGWQVSGIFRAASGLPFSVVIGGDSLGMRNANPFNFPDRLDTPECRSVVNPGNPQHYLKTECFVMPPAGLLGDSGRNSATGPGLMTVDLSLAKNVAMAGRANLQLRFEVFNLLNRANFAVPLRAESQVFNANGVRNARAGVLSATATTARQAQLAAKVTW